jgi:hypothetical protein
MSRTRLFAAVQISLVVSLISSACGAHSTPPPVTVPTPSPHASSLIVGVIAGTLGPQPAMGKAQQRVDELGVHWIREELDWPLAEPEPGVYRWAIFDRLFESAAEHHLHVLPLLLKTPDWAGPAQLGFPTDPATFATFAAHLAARYGPGGTFWTSHPKLNAGYAPAWFELWNEPFTTTFSTGGVDPARYARLVVAAARAGRAANPRTHWLMAADLLYEAPNGQSANWLDALYAAEPDLNRYVGGVAVHPYSYLPPSAGPRAGPLEERFARIGAIESVLRRHGAGQKPMWITELGWSTCSLRPACTSVHDQAQWLADAFTLVRTRYARFVRALFVYHLDDFAVAPDDREDHYGLTAVGGSQKPAWSVVRQEAHDASGR